MNVSIYSNEKSASIQLRTNCASGHKIVYMTVFGVLTLNIPLQFWSLNLMVVLVPSVYGFGSPYGLFVIY